MAGVENFPQRFAPTETIPIAKYRGPISLKLNAFCIGPPLSPEQESLPFSPPTQICSTPIFFRCL